MVTHLFPGNHVLVCVLRTLVRVCHLGWTKASRVELSLCHVVAVHNNCSCRTLCAGRNPNHHPKEPLCCFGLDEHGIHILLGEITAVCYIPNSGPCEVVQASTSDVNGCTNGQEIPDEEIHQRLPDCSGSCTLHGRVSFIVWSLRSHLELTVPKSEVVRRKARPKM